MRRPPRAPAWPPAAAAALAAALLAAVPAGAQSPFALTNLGPDVAATDARMAGRGGWGLAESDTLIPAIKNPAGLVPLTSVVVLLDGYGEARHSRTELDDRSTRRVLLPGARLAFPLAGGRLALTAGFRLLRSTNYETSQDLARTVGADTTLVYLEQFDRQGSQFEVPLAVAWRARPWLSLSAGVDIVRGSIRELLVETFIDPSDYRPALRIQEDDLAGTAGTFGLLLQPHPRLSLGVIWRTGHDLTLDRKVTIENVAASADTSFQLHVPQRWGAGAAVRVGRRWRAGVDYERQPWTDFSGQPVWAAQMRDERVIGFGVERQEARRPRGGLGNLPLRLGAELRRWAYAVGGEDIREHAFSVGTGFAFREGGGHLDLALTRGWVGDLAKNGIEDSYWRLTVSVVGMEKWW